MSDPLLYNTQVHMSLSLFNSEVTQHGYLLTGTSLVTTSRVTYFIAEGGGGRVRWGGGGGQQGKMR